MSFLLYGAYGYTGQLITELAVEHGHRPILAGRDSDKVATMADRFGLKKRVFRLDDPATVARALRGVDAVLHCAGPFVNTAEPHNAYGQTGLFNPDGADIYSQNWRYRLMPSLRMDAPGEVASRLDSRAPAEFSGIADVLGGIRDLSSWGRIHSH